jgi:hypothetical protein
MLGGAVGGYDAIYASTTLGTPVSNWLLVAQNAVAMETWLDPLGGTHFFTYETSGTALYSYKPLGGALMMGPALNEPGIDNARIVETASTAFLVMGFGDGSVRYKAVDLANVSGTIDWNAIADGVLALPAGLGGITLLPESAMYQDNPLQLSVAVNGLTSQGMITYVHCQ